MALVHDSFSDFVLFPRNPSSYLDMLDGRGESGYDGLHSNGPTTSNMHQHFSDLAATTYDPYPPGLAYSSESPPYYSAPQFALDAPKVDAKQPARRWTPSGSPSPSVSQSYDHPPSAVSSVSGASGHSTASSVVGSPYSHPTQSLPGLEPWADSHLGLGIAAGAFHGDRFGHDIFPSTNIDNDLIFEDGKYPSSFVGKSGNISPSSISTSHVKFSAISSPKFVFAFRAPQLALDTSIAAREDTIDTILEQVNSSLDATSQQASPASAISKASPIAFRTTYPTDSTQHAAGSFKPPTTPASAMSSFAPSGFSPPASRQPNTRRYSTTTYSEMNVPRSPPAFSNRFHPYGRSTPPLLSQNQFHNSPSQPPFFSQSSGRYIAPLESSCRFSWNHLLSISFLNTHTFLPPIIVIRNLAQPKLMCWCHRSVPHSAL